MLEIRNLNIEFHDHMIPETVVYDLNLRVDEGEMMGLVGESGSGKTMTALAVAGLLRRHDMKRPGRFCLKVRICWNAAEVNCVNCRAVKSA